MAKITIGGKKDYSNDDFALNRVYPDGRVERIESFKDMDEAIKFMSHKNPATGRAYYDESEQVRAAVQRAMANTPAEAINVQLEPRSPIPTNEEMLRGLREDALKQQHDRLVDQAGGSDLIAKYALAQMLMNPTDEQRQSFTEMQAITQPEGARPYEQHLKNRKAAGLGPERMSAPMQTEEELNEYEARKAQESLDYLASLESDVTEEN